jgi:hypothetical protein
MTFDVGEVINNIIDGFISAPIVGTVARNPIYTALVVTAIIMIIIMIVFRDIDADETLFTMALRSGFWVFIMMLCTLMIHNRVLGVENNQAQKDVNYDRVFNPTRVGNFEPDFVPIPHGSMNGHGVSSGMSSSMNGHGSMNGSMYGHNSSMNSALSNAKVE